MAVRPERHLEQRRLHPLALQEALAGAAEVPEVAQARGLRAPRPPKGGRPGRPALGSETGRQGMVGTDLGSKSARVVMALGFQWVPNSSLKRLERLRFDEESGLPTMDSQLKIS